MGETRKSGNSDLVTNCAASISGSKWSLIVEQVRAWPAESPEWDLVREFVSAIQLEAAQKQVERDERNRAELEHALERLLEHYTPDLAFFEFGANKLSEWRAPVCPLALVSKATTMANDLFDQLKQRGKEGQVPVTNVQAARKQRAVLEAAEDRIIALANQLSDTFSIAEPVTPLQTPQPTSGECLSSKDVEESSPLPLSHDGVSESDTPAVVEEVADDNEVVAEPESSSPSRSKGYDQSSRTSEEQHASGSSLSSAADVARTLLANDTEERWYLLIWSLLAEGDWTAAYWLSRARFESGAAVPVAPPILAVLQGSRWLASEADPATAEIARIVSQTELRDCNADRLTAMAAALWPSLIAPNTGLIGWIPRKDDLTRGLADIAEAVHAFASYGHPISADDISRIEGEVTLEQRTEEIEHRARALLEGVELRKLKIRRATNVLRYMASGKGDIRCVLDPIVAGLRHDVGHVEEHIKMLGSRQELVSRITQIERYDLKHNRVAPPITGEALEQLVRIVGDVVDIARSWCSRVRLAHRISRDGDWWPTLVGALRENFEAAIPRARAELAEVQTTVESVESSAIATVLGQSISRVESLLRLRSDASTAGGG